MDDKAAAGTVSMFVYAAGSHRRIRAWEQVHLPEKILDTSAHSWVLATHKGCRSSSRRIARLAVTT